MWHLVCLIFGLQDRAPWIIRWPAIRLAIWISTQESSWHCERHLYYLCFYKLLCHTVWIFFVFVCFKSCVLTFCIPARESSHCTFLNPRKGRWWVHLWEALKAKWCINPHQSVQVGFWNRHLLFQTCLIWLFFWRKPCCAKVMTCECVKMVVALRHRNHCLLAACLRGQPHKSLLLIVAETASYSLMPGSDYRISLAFMMVTMSD